MARSADRRLLGALALAAVAASASGCATTMQEASRLQLNAARIRASELPTRVVAAGNAVQVTRVATVSGKGGTAFVVQVRNPGSRSVSDLPISVGIRVGHRSLYLNRQAQAEFSYFDAHLPAIAPGATLTWVYESAMGLPARARPFALVGGTPTVTAPRTGHPPQVTAAPAAVTDSQADLVLRNHSTIPQYQLQVYAYAQDGTRFVAAGSLTVPHLGSQARLLRRLPLVGQPFLGRLQVQALPTIVQ